MVPVLWSVLLVTSGCGGSSIWPGAGGGAPIVRTACEPGPLALEMLSRDCTPLFALVPDSQADKPCQADIGRERFYFDDAGNLIAPNAFRYTYRTDGNVERAIMDDADSSMAIRYTYDGDAKLLMTELEGARAKEVHYDFVDGKLVRERSSSGVHNEYVYDGDQLIKIASLSDTSVTAPETAILFEYDGLGRRSSEEHIELGRSTVRLQYSYEAPDSDRVSE